jgi:HAD superfamily hydrolase (TIGR01509 family)
MSFPRKVKAVVFDMDGLLLDSERPVRACTLAAAEEIGQPLSDEGFAALIGQPGAATRAALLEHFGSPARLDDFFSRYRSRMEVAIADGLPLMRGVLEILDHLDALGLPAAVCTSTGAARARHHLERVSIAHRFRTLVGGDDVQRGKPAPDPYLETAKRLAVDPLQCVVLEDSHNGIRAAHAAGMMAVMVPDLLPCTDEIRALCHQVVADLHEARRLFGRQ